MLPALALVRTVVYQKLGACDMPQLSEVAMSDRQPSELTQTIDELFEALGAWSAAVGGAASSQAAAVFVSLYEKVERLERRVAALEEANLKKAGGRP